MELSEKIVFLTGASRGLGLELAIRLLSEGAYLILVSQNRKESDYIEIKKLFKPEQYSVHYCDISSKDELFSLMHEIKNNIGIPDIFIFNAAVVNNVTVNNFDSSLIVKTIEINLFSNIYILDYFIPYLLERRSGCICAVSSLADARGFSGAGFYTPSKAALTNFFEGLSSKLSGTGIKTILIKPGLINTSMSENLGFSDKFKVSPSRSAEIIIRGIKKGKYIIAFPLYQIFIIKIFKILPDRFVLFLLKKFNA